MALPISRNRTYSSTSQVASVDLNDIQDQIIALSNGAHGSRTLVLFPLAATWDPYVDGGWDTVSADGIEAGTGAYGAEQRPMTLHVPIPLRVGDRLLSVKIYGRESASASYPIVLRVWRMTMATGSPGALGGSVNTGGAGGNALVTASKTSLNETIALGYSYGFDVEFAVQTQWYYGAEVTYDRP